MKKYLLSGLFILMFVFISQVEVSQSQPNSPFQPQSDSPFQPVVVNGECHNNSRPVTRNSTLCISGSFDLITVASDETQTVIIYACSGSFGGKSVLCTTVIEDN